MGEPQDMDIDTAKTFPQEVLGNFQQLAGAKLKYQQGPAYQSIVAQKQALKLTCRINRVYVIPIIEFQPGIGGEPGQPSFVLSPKGSRTGPEIPQCGVSSIRRHRCDGKFLEAGRREDPWLSRNLEPLDTTRARLTGTRFKAFVAQQQGSCNPLAGLAAALNREVEHGSTLKDFVL